MSLKGSKTEQHLKAAFERESETNRRYLYFASKADVEGHQSIASLFRSLAESETGHAHGLLEYLEECGDPITGKPFGSTQANLKASIDAETSESTDIYQSMAEDAREEGHKEIADWFEILAKAESTHAERLQDALDELNDKPS